MNEPDWDGALSGAYECAVGYLRGLPERPVGAQAGLAELRSALGGALPDGSTDPAAVVGAPAVRVLVGAERHSTIDRALRLLGLGTSSMTPVEVDGQDRMTVDGLRTALGRQAGPVIVCAQVGNINTGAMDPVGQICALAHDAGAWVHVDGAFGLWAAASPALRSRVTGVERADSWATDAHKWLNVPYDSGLVFCAHPDAHRAAMGVQASYLIHASSGERDALELNPEFSRRARPGGPADLRDELVDRRVRCGPQRGGDPARRRCGSPPGAVQTPYGSVTAAALLSRRSRVAALAGAGANSRRRSALRGSTMATPSGAGDRLGLGGCGGGGRGGPRRSRTVAVGPRHQGDQRAVQLTAHVRQRVLDLRRHRRVDGAHEQPVALGLASVAATRAARLIAAGQGTAAALAGGYHLAFAAAAALVLAAATLAATTLRR